jgi:hypothetical protein
MPQVLQNCLNFTFIELQSGLSALLHDRCCEQHAQAGEGQGEEGVLELDPFKEVADGLHGGEL